MPGTKEEKEIDYFGIVRKIRSLSRDKRDKWRAAFDQADKDAAIQKKKNQADQDKLSAPSYLRDDGYVETCDQTFNYEFQVLTTVLNTERIIKLIDSLVEKEKINKEDAITFKARLLVYRVCKFQSRIDHLKMQTAYPPKFSPFEDLEVDLGSVPKDDLEDEVTVESEPKPNRWAFLDVNPNLVNQDLVDISKFEAEGLRVDCLLIDGQEIPYRGPYPYGKDLIGEEKENFSAEVKLLFNDVLRNIDHCEASSARILYRDRNLGQVLACIKKESREEWLRSLPEPGEKSSRRYINFRSKIDPTYVAIGGSLFPDAKDVNWAKRISIVPLESKHSSVYMSKDDSVSDVKSDMQKNPKTTWNIFTLIANGFSWLTNCFLEMVQWIGERLGFYVKPKPEASSLPKRMSISEDSGGEYDPRNRDLSQATVPAIAAQPPRVSELPSSVLQSVASIASSMSFQPSCDTVAGQGDDTSLLAGSNPPFTNGLTEPSIKIYYEAPRGESPFSAPAVLAPSISSQKDSDKNSGSLDNTLGRLKQSSSNPLDVRVIRV